MKDVVQDVVKDAVLKNREVHARLDAHYLAFLAALFRSDVADAKAYLARFIDLLHAHMETEEREVLPRFADHLPIADDPNALQKIEGDHTILRRTLSSVVEAVASLDEREADLSRALATRIDVFARLKGVLEHHSAREDRDLYPRVDTWFDDDIRLSIVRALDRALVEERG